MNKINKYIATISILLLVVFALGYTNISDLAKNSNQAPDISPSNIAQNAPPSDIINSSFAPDIVVKVSYQGTWDGIIADGSGNRTVHGYANNNYYLDPNTRVVGASFQKTGNDTLPLTVEIVQGRNVIVSETNDEPFGTISIGRIL